MTPRTAAPVLLTLPDADRIALLSSVRGAFASHVESNAYELRSPGANVTDPARWREYLRQVEAHKLALARVESLDVSEVVDNFFATASALLSEATDLGDVVSRIENAATSAANGAPRVVAALHGSLPANSDAAIRLLTSAAAASEGAQYFKPLRALVENDQFVTITPTLTEEARTSPDMSGWRAQEVEGGIYTHDIRRAARILQTRYLTAADVMATTKREAKARLRARLRDGLRPAPRPTHDTSDNFRAWEVKRAATITPATPDEFAALPLPAFSVSDDENRTPRDAVSRTWGIEVEHPDSSNIAAPRGWERKDDCSLRSARGGAYRDSSSDSRDECDYYHDCTDEVEITLSNGNSGYVSCGDYGTECGYCSGDYRCDDDHDDSEDCNEFVSPILHAFNSDELEELLSDLSDRNTNDSAGVHVHVGADEFRRNSALQSRAVYAWALISPIIAPVLQRETRTYCNTFRTAEVLSHARTLSKLDKRRPTDDSDYRYPERYRELNLCALSAHGTLEFRGMGPVYDYETLIRWAHFVRRFVAAVSSDADIVRKLRTSRTLSDVLTVIDWEAN